MIPVLVRDLGRHRGAGRCNKDDGNCGASASLYVEKALADARRDDLKAQLDAFRAQKSHAE